MQAIKIINTMVKLVVILTHRHDFWQNEHTSRGGQVYPVLHDSSVNSPAFRNIML